MKTQSWTGQIQRGGNRRGRKVKKLVQRVHGSECHMNVEGSKENRGREKENKLESTCLATLGRGLRGRGFRGALGRTCRGRRGSATLQVRWFEIRIREYE